MLFVDLLILSHKVNGENVKRCTQTHTLAHKGKFILLSIFVHWRCMFYKIYVLKHLMYVFQLYMILSFLFYASEWHNKYETKILWLLVCFIYLWFFEVVHILQISTPVVFFWKSNLFPPSSQNIWLNFSAFLFISGVFFLIFFVFQ